MISEDKEFEVFANFIDKFGFGKLQDIIQIKNYIEEEGYTFDDVGSYVEWKIQKEEVRLAEVKEHYEKKVAPIIEELVEESPMCPECGKQLYVKHVGLKLGKENKYGYKSVWRCKDFTTDGDCIYEKYNKETKGEIVASFIGEAKTKILGFIK